MNNGQLKILRLYSPWNSLGQNTGVGSLSLLPQDLRNSGIEPRSPALQEDTLPAEPQRKPENSGVGSLSLLQQIFLTQESNQGLLQCRWILYQLSYQGSPFKRKLLRKREWKRQTVILISRPHLENWCFKVIHSFKPLTSHCLLVWYLRGL